MMQSFIVETRKADEKIGIPQLHNILILGRSFAIARGQDSAQLQYLEEAREILKKINDRAFWTKHKTFYLSHHLNGEKIFKILVKSVTLDQIILLKSLPFKCLNTQNF